ncbi:unnamed protein product [Closterium sp. NIES-64]|nr:unnamed protein product [Closterium sp. NIES-64]
MAMLSSWQADPLFPAAEEVQDSADRLRSSFHQWQQLTTVDTAGSGGGGLARVDEEGARLVLLSACDTLKWQLQEFERAVLRDAASSTASLRRPERASGGRPQEVQARRQQFISAIRAQLAQVDTAVRRSSSPRKDTRPTELQLRPLAIRKPDVPTPNSWRGAGDCKGREFMGGLLPTAAPDQGASKAGHGGSWLNAGTNTPPSAASVAGRWMQGSRVGGEGQEEEEEEDGGVACVGKRCVDYLSESEGERDDLGAATERERASLQLRADHQAVAAHQQLLSPTAHHPLLPPPAALPRPPPRGAVQWVAFLLQQFQQGVERGREQSQEQGRGEKHACCQACGRHHCGSAAGVGGSSGKCAESDSDGGGVAGAGEGRVGGGGAGGGAVLAAGPELKLGSLSCLTVADLELGLAHFNACNTTNNSNSSSRFRRFHSFWPVASSPAPPPMTEEDDEEAHRRVVGWQLSVKRRRPLLGGSSSASCSSGVTGSSAGGGAGGGTCSSNGNPGGSLGSGAGDVGLTALQVVAVVVCTSVVVCVLLLLLLKLHSSYEGASSSGTGTGMSSE